MNGSCGLLVGLTQRRLVARLGRECVEFKKLVMGHRVGPRAKLGYAVLGGADLYNAKKLGVPGVVGDRGDQGRGSAPGREAHADRLPRVG